MKTSFNPVSEFGCQLPTNLSDHRWRVGIDHSRKSDVMFSSSFFPIFFLGLIELLFEFWNIEEIPPLLTSDVLIAEEEI